MELRKYQQESIVTVAKSLKDNDRIILVLPTGAGKTVVSKKIIERIISKGKTVLFVAPRRKLVQQTHKAFGFGNILMGADTQDNGSLCTIGSLQTILTRGLQQVFDFIIIDECHYASESKAMTYLLEKSRKIIGLSATPLDTSGYLLEGFDVVVNKVTKRQLIDDGFLVPFKVFSCLIPPVKAQIQNGDYNMEQAGEELNKQVILGNLKELWERHAKGLKTLIFACNISHAVSIQKVFEKSVCVHSNMAEEAIQQAYDDFKNNKVITLINVDMATFGFDEPSIECLLFARPTKSLRLYHQMVGRGARPAPNKKFCIMLDCANVIHDCGMPESDIIIKTKPVFSERLDKILKVERAVSGKAKLDIPLERFEYLKKIANLLDLYSDKTYFNESQLLEDVKNYLDKSDFFFWRQNSGKAFIDKRWVHFTDKNGLPDISLFVNGIYCGVELKLPSGTLTKHQKNTLPEMITAGIPVFIVQSVNDLFEIIQACELLPRPVIQLPETQKKYRLKYKLGGAK